MNLFGIKDTSETLFHKKLQSVKQLSLYSIYINRFLIIEKNKIYTILTIRQFIDVTNYVLRYNANLAKFGYNKFWVWSIYKMYSISD